jgi:hypothetical protein
MIFVDCLLVVHNIFAGALSVRFSRCVPASRKLSIPARHHGEVTGYGQVPTAGWLHRYLRQLSWISDGLGGWQTPLTGGHWQMHRQPGCPREPVRGGGAGERCPGRTPSRASPRLTGKQLQWLPSDGLSIFKDGNHECCSVARKLMHNLQRARRTMAFYLVLLQMFRAVALVLLLNCTAITCAAIRLLGSKRIRRYPGRSD